MVVGAVLVLKYVFPCLDIATQLSTDSRNWHTGQRLFHIFNINTHILVGTISDGHRHKKKHCTTAGCAVPLFFSLSMVGIQTKWQNVPSSRMSWGASGCPHGAACFPVWPPERTPRVPSATCSAATSASLSLLDRVDEDSEICRPFSELKDSCMQETLRGGCESQYKPTR